MEFAQPNIPASPSKRYVGLVVAVVVILVILAVLIVLSRGGFPGSTVRPTVGTTTETDRIQADMQKALEQTPQDASGVKVDRAADEEMVRSLNKNSNSNDAVKQMLDALNNN